MSAFNEIFSKYVTEKLYEGNSFLTHMKNVSEYANGKTVNIPGYVFSGDVAIDGSNFTGATSFDVDRPEESNLTFGLNEYHFAKPLMVTDFDEAMSSYNKLNVAVGDATSTLTEFMGKTILNKLAIGVVDSRKIPTSGSNGTNNSPLKTANRKKISFLDILNLGQKMDEDNVPESGRFLILDSVMYQELLTDSQIINAQNFGETVLPSGVIREIGGINIMKKNTISTQSSAGVVRLLGVTSETLDNRVGFAFHSDAIAIADTGIKTYQLAGDPYKRGNVFSASFVMGASSIRRGFDDAGTYLIVQAS
jgi:hypothetical protein